MAKLVLKRNDLNYINGKKSIYIIVLKERTGLRNTHDEIKHLIKC